MSNTHAAHCLKAAAAISSVLLGFCVSLTAGGGGRDRTDDLKLAKLALSQLSYAP